MTVNTQGPVVLVVDDEPIMRRAFVRAVARTGRRCLEAATCTEALAFFDGQRDPDLVIADLNLDGESGLDLAQRICDAAPGTPVLLATGVQADELAVAPPIVGVLEKPFELDALLRAIDGALAAAPRRPRGA